MNLAERDRRVLWHPYTQEKTAPLPVPIVRGKGVWLETEDGRQILDGISSWWTNIHGHSHPYLNEALAKQAGELEHVIFAGFTHPAAVELAERLIEILPAGLSRVFYSDNGSTAVEVALKLAYQYWANCGEEKRTNFVALTHAYHGDTFGAMAASDESAFTKPYQNLLFKVLRADAPYSYRCPATGNCEGRCNLNCLKSLENVLSANAGTIAAVIVEPMLQGAGGMIVWTSEFLAEVRRLCDEYDTLLIADEVLTGFGRTGKMFACEHAHISPDIICLSKAITGGYLPLGATVVQEKIYNAFLSDDRAKTFFHGHSFTANPLSCAVARASLELFERENTLKKIRRIEQTFNARLPALLELPVVGEVRVIGVVGAIELVADKQTKTAGGYLDIVGQKLARIFLERNLLLRPLGNVLYVMPPYVINDDELNWTLTQVEEVLESL